MLSSDADRLELEYYRLVAKHTKCRMNAEALIVAANKLMDEAKAMEPEIDALHKRVFEENESWINC